VPVAVSTPTSVVVPGAHAVDVQLVPATPPAAQVVTAVSVPASAMVPGAHAVEVQLVPDTPAAPHVPSTVFVPAPAANVLFAQAPVVYVVPACGTSQPSDREEPHSGTATAYCSAVGSALLRPHEVITAFWPRVPASPSTHAASMYEPASAAVQEARTALLPAEATDPGTLAVVTYCPVPGVKDIAMTVFAPACDVLPATHPSVV